MKNLLQSITVAAFIAHLNSLVAPFKGKRIKSGGDITSFVNDAVSEYIAQFGFDISNWHIHHKYGTDWGFNDLARFDTFRDLFMLKNPDFKKDQRFKYVLRGTVAGLHFETNKILDVDPETTTLYDFLKAVLVADIEKEIASNEEAVKEFQAKAEKFSGFIAEGRAKLQKL